MTEQLSAIDAHNKVQEAAHNADASVRVVAEIAIDQAVRQGDIYITRIASVPKDARVINDRQLAPGTSQGSRHVVSGAVTVVARINEQSPLQGPFLKSSTDFIVEHPEHGHIQLPAGDYSCTYQRDFGSEELARIRD